ncbi:DarT ssDNA thymidine ADP-ribosyltransferase family protein, partial [Geobacillus sp. AYS3]
MAPCMIMFLFTLLLGYAINKSRVVGYAKGQDEIIYLVSRKDVIHCGRLRYVFTDGHAIMKITDFYNNLGNLGKIDWNIMYSPFWFETEEDPDRERRRQAEFLVYQFV